MEPKMACKRHKNHKKLQGVCPFCLRERLSRLSAAAAAASSSSLVSHSSSSSSSSPANYYSSASSSSLRVHNRNASEIMGSISFMLNVDSSSTSELKKSRSIAFVPRNVVGEIHHNGKRKQGFWSKLLHRERKKDIFMQC